MRFYFVKQPQNCKIVCSSLYELFAMLLTIFLLFIPQSIMQVIYSVYRVISRSRVMDLAAFNGGLFVSHL
jgi:hypothetical protein